MQNIIDMHILMNSFRMIAIFLLIFSLVLQFNFDRVSLHVRYLRAFSNLNFLLHDHFGLYEIGTNVDESYAELVSFSDMERHFHTVLKGISSFQLESMADFALAPEQVEIYTEFTNASAETLRFRKSEEARDYFFKTDLRVRLLNSARIKVTLHIGSSQLLTDFAIRFEYVKHSNLMLAVNLNVEFAERENASMLFWRFLQRGIALALIFTHLLEKRKSGNESKWSWSLILLNLAVIVSTTLAPVGVFLQLVSFFQPHKEYDFNSNLQHALPLVMQIMLPVYVFLNGFIFYSMLMYPGDYFDDYLKGFFSYAYQLFQTGTYEIFQAVENTAEHCLYVVLYFYVNLVGNSLIPGLFCALIQMKANRSFVRDFVHQKVSNAGCPACRYLSLDCKDLDINVENTNIAYMLLPKSVREATKQTLKVTLLADETRQNQLSIMSFNTKIKELACLAVNNSRNLHEKDLRKILQKVQAFILKL